MSASMLALAILFLVTACGSGDAGTGFSTGGDGDFTPSCSSPWASPEFCGDSGGNAQFSSRPTCGDDDQIGTVDACGVTTIAFDLHDPIVMTVNNLTASFKHSIVIKNPSDVEITPAGGLIAMSDDDGEINKAVVVQNMDPAAELGDYTILVFEDGMGPDPAAATWSLKYTVEDRSRVQCVDSGGNPQASFLTTENAFAKVSKSGGTLADGTYDVYVMDDYGAALANGLSMGSTTLSVTVTGGVGTIDLGTYSAGAYDVVVDVNNNGVFNQGTDLISRQNRLLPCFAVQSASAGAAVMVEQVASDKNGNKREIFDPDANIPEIRDIQAQLTPAQRSTLQQPGAVNTYVVPHQANWVGGEVLADIDLSNETSPAQNDSNSEAPWVLVPYAGLAAGCYDVVIDTGRDGSFTLGEDFVDNIDQDGVATCGVRVSTPGCQNVTITSHTDGTYFATETAVTLEGAILGSPTSAYLTITSGTQSATIPLTVGATGDYSVNLPLFAGKNRITVSGIYADNTSCSKTITLERPTNVALFRAQLTWDRTSTPTDDWDMDLHLVRVRTGGEGYSAGGGGVDDCNYANCKVGLSGELAPNSIDWGVVEVEEDDPSLDVDCITCSDRIENIWMSNISEDGRYEIYVDAWNANDNADNVRVSVFILGTKVAEVDCGSMAADTADDTCFAGWIDWVGGSGGRGTFTPSGQHGLETDF